MAVQFGFTATTMVIRPGPNLTQPEGQIWFVILNSNLVRSNPPFVQDTNFKPKF